MDAKLAADASFFWECVQKRQAGVDITGAAGKEPEPQDARSLFGGAARASAGLNFSQYDAIPVTRDGAGSSEAEVPPLSDAFPEEALPPFVLRNLLAPDRMNIRAPTPIQRHCVPLALAKLDLMGCAQTGSGKTAAFLLPLLASVASDAPPLSKRQVAAAQAAASAAAARGAARGPRRGVTGRLSPRQEEEVRAGGTPARPAALVLAPTRELAVQIELEARKLTCDAPPPPSGAARWCGVCYGGATARPQLEALSGGVEVRPHPRASPPPPPPLTHTSHHHHLPLQHLLHRHLHRPPPPPPPLAFRCWWRRRGGCATSSAEASSRSPTAASSCWTRRTACWTWASSLRSGGWWRGTTCLTRRSGRP